MELYEAWFSGRESPRVKCGLRSVWVVSTTQKSVSLALCTGKRFILPAHVWARIHKSEGKAMDIKTYSNGDLVAIYNAAVPTKTIKKFKDRATAETRITALAKTLGKSILDMAQAAGLSVPVPAAPVAAPTKAAAPAAPKSRMDRAPKPAEEIVTCREGSNQAIVLDLLARPHGASFEELDAALRATGRDILPQTVRSTLSWDICSVKGYGCRSEDGRYFLVLPEGMTAPLPHRPLAKKPEPSAKAQQKAKAKADAIANINV